MNAFVTFVNRANRGTSPGRSWLLVLLACLILAFAFYSRAQSGSVAASKQDKSVGEATSSAGCEADGLPVTAAEAPPGRYLYSERYGWFDSQHFYSGDPAQVLEDVRAAASNGGGLISIRQSVREGITGHTSHYLVAGRLNEAEVVGVALGIYMDWSYRFEAWQGQLPRSLVGPLTAFSIEDLPTHYVGFFAAVRGLEINEVFDCYLGEVETTDEAPPHLLLTDDLETGTLGVPVKHLTNKKFTPIVPTDEGWQNISWPAGLQLAYIDSSSGLWAFEQEETWYFNGD